MPHTLATPADQADEQTLAAVSRAYQGPLERYAAHLLNNDHARGQDVAQDTFQRLLQQPPETRATLMQGFTADTQEAAAGDAGKSSGCEGAGLKAWLFTVCRNRALDVRRKEKRMTPLTAPLADAQQETAPDPAQAAQQHDEHAAVLQKMAHLPANQQEVLRLRFHGELTYPQIAQVTGLTVGNVGYLLHHALKTLRQQLA